MARARNQAGYTLTEITIAVAVIAILAAALTPLAFKLIDDSRVSRAQGEVKVIGQALTDLFTDTGMWPYTRANGPASRCERLVSYTAVPTGAGTGAASGASNWGSYGNAKQLGDFLYWNNPDDNSSSTGSGRNENNQDYPTSGQGAWKGPYIGSYHLQDPWNKAYVINVRYLPGGSYTGTVRHKVMVLSAGPDGKWQTGYDDNRTEDVAGDDIGYVFHVVGS